MRMFLSFIPAGARLSFGLPVLTSVSSSGEGAASGDPSSEPSAQGNCLRLEYVMREGPPRKQSGKRSPISMRHIGSSWHMPAMTRHDTKQTINGGESQLPT